MAPQCRPNFFRIQALRTRLQEQKLMTRMGKNLIHSATDGTINKRLILSRLIRVARFYAQTDLPVANRENGKGTMDGVLRYLCCKSKP